MNIKLTIYNIYILFFENREVSTEEGEQKAKEFNTMFIETSAKAGYNVKPLFRKIAQALPGIESQQQQQQNDYQSQLIDIKMNQNKQNEGCAC